MTTTQVSEDVTVEISPEWLNEVVAMETKFCAEIQSVNASEAMVGLTKSYKVAYQALTPHLARFKNPKILEVGSGYAFQLCYLRKMGLDAHGIEPGNSVGFEGRFEQASKLLKDNGIDASQVLHSAVGESLPFEDNSFDIVYALDVIEHVRDVHQVLKEMARVVKPDGTIVIAVVNYDSFKELHYNILWLPYLLRSKTIAKWWVRTVFQRKDWFVDDLQFIRPSQFRHYAAVTPELRKIQMVHTIDGDVPVLGPFFQKNAGRHYELQNLPERSPAQEKEYRKTGSLLKLAEVLGFIYHTIIVWDRPKEAIR